MLCFLFCLSSSCVLCVQCCQCLWIVHSWLPLVLFVFVLCLVCPMLPVSLDCPFLIAPCFVYLCPVSFVSNAASVSELSILDCSLFCLPLSCVLCVQCCSCLWIVHSWLPLVLFVFVLCLVCPMLLVSLDCPFLIAPCFVCLCPVSCASNVASVSGLSILDCPLFCLPLSCVFCVQCCQCLWIVHSWLLLVLFTFVLCLECPMLLVSLDCPFLIAPCFVYLCPVSFVSNAASVSEFSILDCSLFCLPLSCVLCVQCCSCLWIVHSWLPLVLFVFVLCIVCPMLPVSLDCPFLVAPCFVYLCPVSCVSNVARVSGLSILDCPLFCLPLSCVFCVQCCQCL